MRIEDAKHRSREKEHGKNYLLETYLNGLNEAPPNDGDEEDCEDDDEDDEANGANRSDSGVHEGTSSPEVGQSASNQGDTTPHHQIGDPAATSVHIDLLAAKYDCNSHSVKRKSISKRETELLHHHECSKELVSLACAPSQSVLADANMERACSLGDVAEQIEWLQKVIEINKHLQREEELVVRLSTKVRKCQADDRTMSAHQIQEALGIVNTSLDYTSNEMERMQNELELSGQILDEKENVILELSAALEQEDASANMPADSSLNLGPLPLEQKQPLLLAQPEYAVDNLVHQPAPPMPIQMFRTTDPLYFEKRDCGITSINMLHLNKNLNIAQPERHIKVGPKKWLHTEQDSYAGHGMVGEDAMVQVGTLV